MLRYFGLVSALVLSGCAKQAPIENARSQVGAGLLLAAPLARMLASEIDSGDGAVGCIVAETLGEALEAAGRQLATGKANPDAEVDICECLSLRSDWQAIDIPSEIASQSSSAIEAVSILVTPYIVDCEASAWFTAAAEAIAILAGPISDALSLEQCTIPIPPIAPNLEACDG